MDESPTPAPPPKPRRGLGPTAMLWLLGVVAGAIAVVGYIAFAVDEGPHQAGDSATVIATATGGDWRGHLRSQFLAHLPKPVEVAIARPATPAPAPTPLPSASPTPLPSPTAKASKQSATPAAFRAAAAKLGHPAFVAKVRKPKAHRNAVAPAAGWQATYASLRHLASPSAVAVSDGSQSDAAQPSPRTTEEATAAPTERPLPSAAQKVNHSPKIAPSPAAVALAPAAPVDDGPIYAPEKIVAPRFLFADQPDFPEMLRNQGVHASSIVLATVGPNGNLISARIGTSSGYSALDRAALAAARASRYAPPTIDGRAATETYRISYDFSP